MIPRGWPVDRAAASVSSWYGIRQGGRLHNGVDFAAPKGTPVFATAPGEVVFADRDGGGYGRLIRLDHGDGLETWYAHLKRISVRRGKMVLRGQQIGTVGASGRATGPHVHYEIRRGGRPVDPVPYLGK